MRNGSPSDNSTTCALRPSADKAVSSLQCLATVASYGADMLQDALTQLQDTYPQLANVPHIGERLRRLLSCKDFICGIYLNDLGCPYTNLYLCLIFQYPL